MYRHGVSGLNRTHISTTGHLTGCCWLTDRMLMKPTNNITQIQSRRESVTYTHYKLTIMILLCITFQVWNINMKTVELHF